MKLELSNGEVALVDDDFADLLKWKWQLDSTGYPSRGSSTSGKKCHLRLHTIVMGKAPVGFVTDHINGNKLDNRRQNLRFCSQRINTLNKNSGVSWHVGEQAWRVRFNIRGRELFYGNFKDRAEAESVAHLLKGALMYYELTKGDSSGQ